MLVRRSVPQPKAPEQLHIHKETSVPQKSWELIPGQRAGRLKCIIPDVEESVLRRVEESPGMLMQRIAL